MVTVRRSKTVGYVPFAFFECGYTFPLTIGTSDGRVVESFLPNAATGLLLQCVLRGHVEASSIIEDEATFWSKRPDAGNRALISTSEDSQSSLLSLPLFALPVTAEFVQGYHMDRRSLIHQLEVEAYHANRDPADIELAITNYNMLIDTFCESFNISKYLVSPRSFR